MLLVFQLFNSELQTLAPLSQFGLRLFFFSIPFEAFLSPVPSLLDLLEVSSSRVEQALVFYIEFFFKKI